MVNYTWYKSLSGERLEKEKLKHRQKELSRSRQKAVTEIAKEIEDLNNAETYLKTRLVLLENKLREKQIKFGLHFNTSA